MKQFKDESWQDRTAPPYDTFKSNRLNLADMAQLSGNIRFLDDGNTLTMIFPMMRFKALSATLATGALVFAGICSLFLSSLSFLGLIFLVPFLLMTLALIGFCVYLTFNSRTTVISHSSVSTHLQMLGTTILKQSIKTCNIRNLSIRKSGRINKLEYFQLIANGNKSSEAIVLADTIQGRELADTLRHYLLERISRARTLHAARNMARDELIV